MKRLRPAALCLAITLPFALSACGDDDSGASGDRSPGQSGDQSGGQGGASTVAAPTLAEDGPAACFDAIADHLGADVKVNEVSSSFSPGKEIKPSVVNPEDTPPAGNLTYCSVKYQNPDDALKLLETTLDLKTGEFSSPAQLEITVMGDASNFVLDDYVIALSDVSTESLAAVMEEQESRLTDAYSIHAWSTVRLSPPDNWSPVHTLRIDVTGRLAANDIVEGGYMELATDGTTVNKDYLVD